MSSKTYRTKSRISKAAINRKSRFKFRWWMALVLVLVVAVVGIAVFRFSHAFGGGKIYIYGGNDGPYVSYDFNLDGTVNLTESITNKERKNVPFSQAQAVGLQMVQDAMRATGQGDVANTLNPGSLPADVQSQISSADQQSKQAQSQTTAKSKTPSNNTSGQPAPTTSTTATPASPAITNTTSQPPPKTYPVSGTVDFHLPSSITKQAAQATYKVDGEQLGISKTSPFNQSFNSNKYENGTHLLQVEIKDAFGANKTYVYALQVQNPTNWWSKLVQNFSNVFGQ